jgi:hypothetical protein
MVEMGWQTERLEAQAELEQRQLEEYLGQAVSRAEQRFKNM